jgi:hypothetical protein
MFKIVAVLYFMTTDQKLRHSNFAKFSVNFLLTKIDYIFVIIINIATVIIKLIIIVIIIIAIKFANTIRLIIASVIMKSFKFAITDLLY